MNDNEIWVFADGKAHRHRLRPLARRPVGHWSVMGNPVDDDHVGSTVSETLGKHGSSLVPQRYPVSTDGIDPDELFEIFSGLCRRGRHYDCIWLNLTATVGEDEIPHRLALLTESQMQAVPDGRTEWVGRMANGQELTTIPDERRRRPIRELTVECQSSRYHQFSPAPGEIVLATTPSAPYAERLATSHSYYCIANKCHRDALGHGYVLLRNAMLEEDYHDLRARLAVRVVYSDRVPEDRVVLDISAMVAIGLPAGEVIGVRRLHGRSGRIQRRIFGNRHSIVRALKTTTMDMEKPVARMPQSVFDLLGLPDGGRIVLEAAAIEDDASRLSRLTLRALPIREISPTHLIRTRIGVPDIPSLVGQEDFPPIYIDVNARQKLGISPGSAVYVRPAVTNILAREFTAISLALIAAIAASSALKNVAVAVAATVLYVLFASLIAIRRLR